MARNEMTSKRVASTAGALLRQCRHVEREVMKLTRMARSVAGSALTQARDRKG